MTGNVFPLSAATKAPSRRRDAGKLSLRELVVIADDVRPELVPQTIKHKLDMLLSDGPPRVAGMPAHQLREWVIVGGLINRLLFQLLAVPQDPKYRL